jgi:hypothetical protein
MSFLECSEPGCGREAVWHCSHCWSWQCCERHFDHDCVRPWTDRELDSD